MASKKQNERQTREARERLRAYNARVAVHQRSTKRRRRDNIVATIGVLVILVLAILAQLLYFGGPGKTAPTASPTPTASATPTSADSADADKTIVPPATLAEGRTWKGTMTINGIPLSITLDGKDAPQAVSSTISLINKKFYEGLTCHRLTNGGFYVLQCGDPNGDGTGGPGYSYGPVENAPSDNVYDTGVLAMARQKNNAASQGSQFFIVYDTTKISSDDAGGYTIIGHITSGLDDLKTQVIDKGLTPVSGKNDGTPKVPTKIDSISIK